MLMRWLRESQPKVRSTIHHFGRTVKPCVPGVRNSLVALIACLFVNKFSGVFHSFTTSASLWSSLASIIAYVA